MRNKYISSVLAIIIISFTLCGCTHNNGDIGHWFGTWQMTALNVDGHPYLSDNNTEYQKNIFWKFQSNVIELVQVSSDPDAHTYQQRFGTWEEGDGTMTVNFNYTDELHGTGFYKPYYELGLPIDKPAVMKITSQKGNNVTFTYNSENGKTYTYTLHKI